MIRRSLLSLLAAVFAAAPLAAAQSVSAGFIRTWLLCGAFAKSDIEAPVVTGEADLDPRPGSVFRGKAWKEYTAVGDVIDFSSPLAMEYAPNAAAYGFVRVHSKSAQAAQLLLGSDDGVRVWLNGEEVLSHVVARAQRSGEEKLRVFLRPGWNRLLLKVGNYYGGWSFSCQITDSDGRPLEGLKYDPEPLALDALPVQKVLVSSYEGGRPDARPLNLLDGDTGTRWASEHVDPQFVILDFGAPQVVSRLTLQWENAYAEAFRLEASDNRETWEPLYETEEFTGGEFALSLPKPRQMRYLRLFAFRRGTPWGYSLWEMTAYGKAATPAFRGRAAEEVLPASLPFMDARASSRDGDMGAPQAVDGNGGTRWSSRHGNDPEWIELDLGKVRMIRRLVLQWENAYAFSYKIEVSRDRKKWAEVYKTEAGDGKQDDILLEKRHPARYIRLTGFSRATKWGYSLWEVQAFED